MVLVASTVLLLPAYGIEHCIRLENLVDRNTGVEGLIKHEFIEDVEYIYFVEITGPDGRILLTAENSYYKPGAPALRFDLGEGAWLEITTDAIVRGHGPDIVKRLPIDAEDAASLLREHVRPLILDRTVERFAEGASALLEKRMGYDPAPMAGVAAGGNPVSCYFSCLNTVQDALSRCRHSFISCMNRCRPGWWGWFCRLSCRAAYSRCVTRAFVAFSRCLGGCR